MYTRLYPGGIPPYVHQAIHPVVYPHVHQAIHPVVYPGMHHLSPRIYPGMHHLSHLGYTQHGTRATYTLRYTQHGTHPGRHILRECAVLHLQQGGIRENVPVLHPEQGGIKERMCPFYTQNRRIIGRIMPVLHPEQEE